MIFFSESKENLLIDLLNIEVKKFELNLLVLSFYIL